MMQRFPCPPAAVEAAFRRADVNGDGTLSRDEAVRLPAIALRFNDLDTNKDGCLSLEKFGGAPNMRAASSAGEPRRHLPHSASRARRSLFQYTSSPPRPSRLARLSTRASTNSRSLRRFR